MNRLIQRYRGLQDPLRTQRVVELAVVLLAVVLVLQLVWAMVRLLVPAVPGAVRPTADAMRVAPASAYAVPGADQRAEIRGRPLFWETRRPVAGAEVAPPVEREEKSASTKLGKIKDVTLAGVFGSGKSAGIIYTAKGKERRIMVGDELNGWKLESVEPTRAVFQGNGRSAELDLKRGTIEVSEAVPATAPEVQNKKAASATKTAAEDTLTLGGRGVPVRR